jgi:hypothetical protein
MEQNHSMYWLESRFADIFSCPGPLFHSARLRLAPGKSRIAEFRIAQSPMIGVG